MKKIYTASIILVFLLACSLPSAGATEPVDLAPATPLTPLAQPATDTPVPTLAPPTETFTPTLPPPTETSTPTAIPFVESLKSSTMENLTCRYGPGAEYLSLFAFNKGANIQIIGRTDGNNWVLVENKIRCWVNAKFLDIKGDKNTLQVMYPDKFKLIVSPYYSAPIVLSAVRDPNNRNKVTVKWTDIALRPGDEEDENMFIYIIEVWRCEGGKMISDPLASNYPEVTFVDETGCSVASHGRVFFQEKHGFAGPAEISWPER